MEYASRAIIHKAIFTVVYFLDNDQYPHEEADMKGKQYLYIRIDWHEGKSLICVIIYVRNIIDR